MDNSHKQIKNKIKRKEVYSKLKKKANDGKKERKRLRAMEIEKLGEDVVKKAPKTLDNTREKDETIVSVDDNEICKDEMQDEFKDYYLNKKTPKICITTSRKATPRMFQFIEDLLRCFPNSFFYERRGFEVKDIIEQAIEKDFTDLIIINEDRKEPNGLLLTHLPDGPTAHFKLSNLRLSSEIPGKGAMSNHKPELVLNRFNTRLGRRVGRMLGALVEQAPDFRGRRVLTFHNQRDYIFFRQHRYVFEGEENVQARLQELGPQFTLKLRSLQAGTFDSSRGEYEWTHHPDQDTSRTRFFL